MVSGNGNTDDDTGGAQNGEQNFITVEHDAKYTGAALYHHLSSHLFSHI
jgi:hypothetical protein